MKIFFDPPQKKCTILNYFKGNFSTPLKRNVQFFHPPQAGLQKMLTPSPVDHHLTAGLKMTNPLLRFH
jgi:hypothetical protein